MLAIRDPVHDWIKCSPCEKKIIDSPLFQRLHWVSQLNSVKQVFPGGVHTRFLHSLGAMHLSGQYMTHLLGPDLPVAPQQHGSLLECHAPFIPNLSKMRPYYIQLARIAGLLHDIGHGPFSHAFDRAIYQQLYPVKDGGHDFHRLIMIKSDLLRPLVEECGIDINHVIAVWSKKTPEYCAISPEDRYMFDIIHAVVQGPLGADRMDFTLRDSYFTGTSHLGTIDSNRIISNSSIRQVGNDPNAIYLHYHFKCMSDIIQALAGRYYMYDGVYLHKTSSAANILIEEMLKKSAKTLKIIERTQDLDKFQWLNDSTVIGEILAYNGDDSDMLLAQKYCKNLLQRKLPKLREQLMIDQGQEIDLNKYLDMYSEKLHIPKDNLVILRTRSIIGIDATKFDENQLKFWISHKTEDNSHDGESISCKEALHKIKYTRPQEPYYLVRIYQMHE